MYGQTAKLRHLQSQYAPVAQLDRVLPSEGRGHRFESCRARHLINSLQVVSCFFIPFQVQRE